MVKVDISLVHSSFHKCLTRYYMNIMDKLFNKILRFSGGYEHFESIEGQFYNNYQRYRLVSVNNFAIDLDRLQGDCRVSRFIRDPRDLIVSGYFYHKRGAEPWFRMKNPTRKYWEPINGNLPDNFPADISYSDYLQSLSLEEGLIAEIQFRKFHLESMLQWEENPAIKLFKYEEILGNEKSVFQSLFEFYGFSRIEKIIGSFFVNRYRASKMVHKSTHLRNPQSGQWKSYFTPEVHDYFNSHYEDILDRYDYTK